MRAEVKGSFCPALFVRDTLSEDVSYFILMTVLPANAFQYLATFSLSTE